MEYPGAKNVKNVKKSEFLAYFAHIWAYDVMGGKGKGQASVIWILGVKRSSRHLGSINRLFGGHPGTFGSINRLFGGQEVIQRPLDL